MRVLRRFGLVLLPLGLLTLGTGLYAAWRVRGDRLLYTAVDLGRTLARVYRPACIAGICLLLAAVCVLLAVKKGTGYLLFRPGEKRGRSRANTPAGGEESAFAPAGEAPGRGEAPPEEAPRYCGRCGTAVKPGTKFCAACGNPI